MSGSRSTHVRYPGGMGTVYGMAAYVLGYLLAYPLASGRVSGALQSTAFETPDGPVTAAQLLATHDVTVVGWQGVGWLFYNAHFVSLQLPGPPRGPTPIEANVLTSAGGTLWLLVAIPPLALVVAGAMVTRDVSDSIGLRYDFGTGGARYAINGGLVTTLGYLPLASLGTFVFTAGYLGPVGPSILGGWVIAGGIYPFAFGAVGGYLGGRFGASGDPEQSDAGETGW